MTDDRNGEQPELDEKNDDGAAPRVEAAAEADGGSATGRGGVSRRALIGWTGGALAVGAAAAGGVAAAVTEERHSAPRATTTAVPFEGAHQAGIATPVQDRLHFVSFDVITEDRAKLVRLLQQWTAAARAMTQGQAVGKGAVDGIAEAPPDDTGEAVGLPPANLTLTIGFGPSLFVKDNKDRFGIAAKRPVALAELPPFPGDNLEPARSGGDICIQACADDPQVAVHAIRNLARIGFGTVAVRWSQLGFGKTSSTTPDAQTPRNMFGFKDGTRNIAGSETDRLDKHVWARTEDGSDWMTGGSYLVARRIRMHIETWDRTPLGEQEEIIGRTKGEGAPHGAVKERDEVPLKALKETSHVRLSHPDSNDGVTILRRGYSFVDGSDGLGRLDAGLFFLAYMRDPARGFIPLQQKLASHDAMNEYIQHVGSALFACPPGVRGADDWWGKALFG
ncbi:iron uptake transporter deferrochelatase/peroxidase subunit [Yinghuangia seranimata]|uniref:iron uptake transporter deferrochelatase/peroxidase subunit n=1 Tax=Yinghuangia seranimata TaxID=408067 RepID=UPI00248B6560|nr:iron uptake transporter deferrochelatase/peroxidase subunit [Yinghuangia seranimata]MDI2125114.1 iron uptake transporter deferrochelatase/peroxidase subunit [Yinghuangia seranimata]